MKQYRIEWPVGQTYDNSGPSYQLEGYGVYSYDTYPRDSVLAGHVRRSFISVHPTLIEAVRACPERPEIADDVS